MTFRKKYMSPVCIVFLCLYGLSSAANLIFCFLENEKLRKASKPFCLLTLLLFALLYDYSNIWLCLSLSLAWLGDILFIFKKKKTFVVVGIFAFLLAHIFYLFEFGYIFKQSSDELFNSYCFLLRFYPLFILPAIPVSLILSKKDITLTILGSIYQSVLIMVFASSIFAAAMNCSLYYLMIAGGAVLYFTSDFFNAYTMFIKKLKKRELIIMSTYLAAQLLICLGFYLVINLG